MLYNVIYPWREVGKMSKARILAISLLAVLVLLIGMGTVACGGNGDENGAPPPGDENGAPPAGDENGAPPEEVEMELTSAAFADGGTIPADYSCDGQDISPALSWSGAPQGTQSFALILDDPDSPGGDFTHWVIFNIPADATGLEAATTDGALQGENDFGTIGYRGPCPPSGSSHHYRFTLYALDIILELDAGATRAQLLDVMASHILAQAELVGVYQR
jgi:Raf kinase inhibitor-like YbhB/YbcL family protein